MYFLDLIRFSFSSYPVPVMFFIVVFLIGSYLIYPDVSVEEYFSPIMLFYESKSAWLRVKSSFRIFVLMLVGLSSVWILGIVDACLAFLVFFLLWKQSQNLWKVLCSEGTPLFVGMNFGAFIIRVLLNVLVLCSININFLVCIPICMVFLVVLGHRYPSRSLDDLLSIAYFLLIYFQYILMEYSLRAYFFIQLNHVFLLLPILTYGFSALVCIFCSLFLLTLSLLNLLNFRISYVDQMLLQAQYFVIYSFFAQVCQHFWACMMLILASLWLPPASFLMVANVIFYVSLGVDACVLLFLIKDLYCHALWVVEYMGLDPSASEFFLLRTGGLDSKALSSKYFKMVISHLAQPRLEEDRLPPMSDQIIQPV